MGSLMVSKPRFARALALSLFCAASAHALANEQQGRQGTITIWIKTPIRV